MWVMCAALATYTSKVARYAGKELRYPGVAYVTRKPYFLVFHMRHPTPCATHYKLVVFAISGWLD